MSVSTAIVVGDSSQASVCRMRATELATSIGFDHADAHRVGIVATELATNLVKHAVTGGELLIRVTAGAPPEIELTSIDRGPGIADIKRSLEDGYSTAGSSGHGLGAVQRMSDNLDVFSQVGRGTAIVARLRANRKSPAETASVIVGAVSVPFPGERVCGDAWVTQKRASGLGLMVADGLGHGLHAADAANAAASAFTQPYSEPAAALERIHLALRHTRGAAAAVADLRVTERIVRFAGVGNIVGVICGSTTSRQMVSLAGTLGHQVRQFRDYSYPWEQGNMLVLHSDGLSASWSIQNYPGIMNRHPSVLAAVLYRDVSRGRDDATVVVAKEAA